MRKLVVFLVLVVILLAVLDRVAVSGAQREIARQLAAQYDLSTPPAVTIEGIPFLTQAVAGRYQEIAVDLGSLTREGVRLSDVDATLYGVTASLADLIQNPAAADIRADRVTGSVVIPMETIRDRAPDGVEISGDGGETLKVRSEITVRGVPVPVQADVKVEVVDGAIRLSPARVTVAGGIPVPANASRTLTYTIPVENLPLDLKVTAVESVPDGLRVTGEARDVPLRQ
ncbi:hypothetical protein HNP84_008596 [Thermocatellispora tengchongensis]|uniref:DUF2993 domain-containing protein n=1 Tax=Thermocatellispora tengchongensis TaxID=1073253 RepID=A0A840PGZ5_9ACTN|nr:DUF2993 domain-containing protein [Thermocatellispora tengchongensis]MBB5138838.1 hypothetical protein [Thermocatellispora tengchongensis]